MYCHPNGINNSNGNSNSVNMRVACNTTGLATFDFLNVEVPDGWNGIDTKVNLLLSRFESRATFSYLDLNHGQPSPISI